MMHTSGVIFGVHVRLHMHVIVLSAMLFELGDLLLHLFLQSFPA